MALTAAFQLGQTHGQILGSQSKNTYGIPKPAKPPAPKPQAKPRTAAPSKPPPKPPPTLYEQAQKIAQAQTAAQIAAIRQQQDLYSQQGRERAQQIALASQAAAKYFSGLGDLTQSSYQQAAQNIAGLASGFSGQLGQEATSDAGKVAANLAALGAPAEGAKTATGQTVQPEALQNALYGLGGFIPGNLLATLGPLQAQQARELPNQLLSYGQQQAAGTISAGQQQADTLTGQILNAQAGTPDLVRSILASLTEQTKPQIFGDSSGGYYALTPDGKITPVVAGTGGQPKIFGNSTSGYYALGTDGKVTRIVGGLGRAASGQTTHLQSKNVNGHTVTFDPATGTYYIPGTTTPVDPNSLSKPAPKITAEQMAKARSYLLAVSNQSGYYAYKLDLDTPISPAEYQAALKRDKNSVVLTAVHPHDDAEIQRTYLTLVKKYGIPALRAFNMVAGQYRQWGQAKRPSYFPKASAAQGAASGASFSNPAALLPGGFNGIDQGVDFTAGKTVRAFAGGVVSKISPAGSFRGGTGHAVYITLDSPIRINGRTYTQIYYAEQTPLVRIGQRVNLGQGVMAAGGNEIGFASNGQPVGRYRGKGGKSYSQAGQDFADWLGVGSRTARI